jgi:predicted acetyltransferase
MADILTREEYESFRGNAQTQPFTILSNDEYSSFVQDTLPPAQRGIAFTDYLRTVPATAVDITLGAGEGFASAIGEFTGNYNLARKIGDYREDINDVIMGDAPDEIQSDFAYKIASGFGSTVPYLAAALVSRRGGLATKAAANAFFLSSAGQQVRDDYLATQGVTSETASDEQMAESNRAGAIGAIPIALAERLGAGLILRPFMRGPIPAGQVMNRIKQYAMAGVGEGLTEATQSGIINAIAAEARKYDPNRPFTAGMAESALIGFLVGGGVNMGVDTVQRKFTQADRLAAGIQDGSINPKDVIDPDIGSKLTEVAIENNAIPEADTAQQQRITDPNKWNNFVSKSLTPLSRRLGRAGKDIVRAFRKYELDVGVKTKDLRKRILDFQTSMQKLKKTSPKDYETLSLALANANELSESLPQSTQKALEKKAQIQPEINFSSSEKLLLDTNPDAQLITSQIESAREALKQRGLNTRIEIVEEGNSQYDPNANVITISATQADASTVGHEYFHAIIGRAVKTDQELQVLTRDMFDSVIRGSVDGSSINEQLKDFVSQYDTNIQNEEFLAQTVGELSRQYTTLDLNTRTRIKLWINQAMRLLGIDGIFKQAETDAEVIEQLNAFARFAGTPEALTGADGALIQSGVEGDNTILEPIRASKFTLKDLTLAPRVEFSSTPENLSNITDQDSVDIISVINDAVAKNKNVIFWQADQLGIGDYTSPVSNKVYDLDAGLGFAKSTAKGREKYVWATSDEDIARKVSKADLIFMISGEPQSMHFFNKEFSAIVYDNIIASQGSLEQFIDNLLQSKNTADNTLGRNIEALTKDLDSKDQRESYINSLARKEVSKFIKKRQDAVNQQGATSEKLWNDIKNILPSENEFRDGHLVKNNFGIRDIYAVFEPNGKFGTDSNMHSTYNVGVEGKFLGTPDRRINISEILSEKYMDAFRKEARNKNKSEKVLGAKLAGSQQTYRPYRGTDLKQTTQKQINDAIAREKALLKKPATAEQMQAGVDVLRQDKQQKPRTTKYIFVDPFTGTAQTPPLTLSEIEQRMSDPEYEGPLLDYRNMKEFTAETAEELGAEQDVEEATDAKEVTPQELQETILRKPKKQKVRGNKAFQKWFGNGVLKFENGDPMVLYHGSKQDDITSFKSARSEGLIFFSTNPEFAENWVRGTGGIRDRKSPAGIKEREERARRNREEDKAWERSVDWDRVQREEDTTAGGISPYYEEMYAKHPRKSRMSEDVIDTAIYPVYLNSKKIFDPRVDFKIAEDFVLREAKKTGKKREVDAVNQLIQQGRYRVGNWTVYENKPMVDFLKTKGYDTMLLSEEASAKGSDAEHETLAVFSPSMIKSAIGNRGTFSEKSTDIREQKKRPRKKREPREYTASDIERARGLSNEGLQILEKYNMVRSYQEVRNVLEQLKDEYQALGLDMNYIENYFPRLMKDLEGFKKSIGQTVGIDEEIRRHEATTGQRLTPVERQKMYEKLARSKMYRGGISQPKNLKERRKDFVRTSELKYYAEPQVALDEYIERMVNTIETKRLIGDAQSGRTVGRTQVAGTLGQTMDQLASQGRLRQDQIDVIQGAVQARFGQHGRQYGFVKGMKNAGYLATMGNTGSTLTQLGDFYFTMVQNGLLPTIRAAFGSKVITTEDLGIAKDLVTIETKDGVGFFGKSVDKVFKITGLTAMDRLAKNTNINAAYRVLQKGAKSNQNSKAYQKTLTRLKRTQGNDAFKTIADLQNGVKSDFVIEALYNELADVAPISLTEMPETYASNPNLRIVYSLKSYTIKQFNFVRERAFAKIYQGAKTGNVKMFSEGSVDLMRILAFGALANGSADVLKAILFNREIDDEDFWWNHFLRIFGITKYTTITARDKGIGEAVIKTILPPQASIIDDIGTDLLRGKLGQVDGIKLIEARSLKYFPIIGKLLYWREGKGVDVEEKLSRFRSDSGLRKSTGLRER